MSNEISNPRKLTVNEQKQFDIFNQRQGPRPVCDKCKKTIEPAPIYSMGLPKRPDYCNCYSKKIIGYKQVTVPKFCGMGYAGEETYNVPIYENKDEKQCQ